MSNFNRDAEDAIISYCITNDGKGVGHIQDLYASDFYDLVNAAVFDAAQKIYDEGRPVSLHSLMEKLSTNPTINMDDTRRVLLLLSYLPPSIESITDAVATVRDKSLSRQIVQASAETIEMGNKPGVSPAELLERTEEQAQKIAMRSGRRKPMDMGEAFKKFMEDYQLRIERARSGKMAGESTGIPGLDAITSGLQAGHMFVVAGRPGSGKTALGVYMADAVLSQSDTPVLMFSIEMPTHQIVSRMLCINTGASSSVIQKADLLRETATQIAEYAHKCKTIKDRFQIIDNPSVDIRTVRSVARKWASTTDMGSSGFGIIVVDYLQIVKSEEVKGETPEQKTSKVSSALKQLARETGCCILALCQMNRSVEKRESQDPVMSDLRESGQIEQDADIIVMIKHKNGSPERGLHVVKNRHGMQGVVNTVMSTVNYRFAEVDGE